MLLSQSDWVELPSNRERMSDQQLADWSCYRQSLRDITNQSAFPEVVWPVRPA
ncbi:phage tail assembly chaperone [Aeromonas salmonicida]|uniref:phage tail assembly chaperone n=1 Tax=Aeromonas salmonicida TaxID=645 RepID=UPI003B987255